MLEKWNHTEELYVCRIAEDFLKNFGTQQTTNNFRWYREDTTCNLQMINFTKNPSVWPKLNPWKAIKLPWNLNPFILDYPKLLKFHKTTTDFTSCKRLPSTKWLQWKKIKFPTYASWWKIPYPQNSIKHFLEEKIPIFRHFLLFFLLSHCSYSCASYSTSEPLFSELYYHIHIRLMISNGFCSIMGKKISS